MREEVLYAENLATEQANQQNLEYVSFSLLRGEILGITGLNGSGLSTLADVLTGRTPLCGGTLYVGGRPVSLFSREQAKAEGIYEVSYSLSMIPTLSVSENLNVLGRGSLRNFFIHPHMNADTTRMILDTYHINSAPEEKAGRLTDGQRAELSVCRAILCGARILVCRELGEGFNESEEAEFTRFLHQLRDEGIHIILLNSDARKLLRYADRIAVMRNGTICYCRETAETDTAVLYRCMAAARPFIPAAVPPEKAAEGPALRFEGVRSMELNCSFDAVLRPGRTLGLLWESGNAGSAVFQIFSGKAPADGTVWAGKKRMPFQTWRNRSRGEILCLGMRFWERNLFENLTAGENLLIRGYRRGRGTRAGILSPAMQRLALREFAEEHGIEPEIFECYPRHLPAEMRCQIVLWGALLHPPKVLILDNPIYTADEYIRNNFLLALAKLKAAGTAALWSSNEQLMLRSCCDEIITIAKSGISN